LAKLWFTRKRARGAGAALASALCLFACGCRATPEGSGPSIEFTRVPPSAEGSPDKLDILQGHVKGQRAGQRVVLYAKTGSWWVQPVANEPFTDIAQDSTFINTTHVGTEYAALLVDANYAPVASLNAPPAVSEGVAAVAIAKGGNFETTPTHTLNFSGYEWRVRDAPSDRGGHRNQYNWENVWTDASGFLHMRVAKKDGDWSSSEITLTRSFGYGTYAFVVRDMTQLDPAAVFDVFTWDYAGGNANHREMNVEVSRWGDPATKNAQFVVQPFYVGENVSRFELPKGAMSYTMHWEPGRATFRAKRVVDGSNADVAAEHVFASGIPTPGAESVRIAFYFYRASKEPIQKDQEIVVEKFEYLP
jgi:hypothetical protein